MTVIPGLWLLTSSSIFRFVGEGASTPLRLQCEERSLFCPSVERAAGEVVTKIQLLQCLDRYQKQCYTACFFLLCAAVETATDLFGAMRTVGAGTGGEARPTAPSLPGDDGVLRRSESGL